MLNSTRVDVRHPTLLLREGPLELTLQVHLTGEVEIVVAVTSGRLCGHPISDELTKLLWRSAR